MTLNNEFQLTMSQCDDKNDKQQWYWKKNTKKLS